MRQTSLGVYARRNALQRPARLPERLSGAHRDHRAMTTTLKISRVLGVSSDPTNTGITIKVQLEDGSEVDLIMSGPTAQVLAPIVHREVRKLADLIRRGTEQTGQVLALNVQSVHMGHDLQTRSSMILFDHGKLSEAAYRLSENQLRDLGRGLMQVMQALSGKSQDDPH